MEVSTLSRKKRKVRAEPLKTKVQDSFQNVMARTGLFMPNLLETTDYPLTRFTRD